MTRSIVRLLAFALLAACFPAAAVWINPEGRGQALLFPYYTVQSAGADAYNTLISITNTANDVKDVLVRFREGRNGNTTFQLQVFLGGKDTWTAALVPGDDGGTRLVTHDKSCTDLAVPASGFPFYTFFFGLDNLGGGTDRTREGRIEVFELATLNGPLAARLSQSQEQRPDCTGVHDLDSPDVLAAVAPPTGGIAGSASLINVNRGLDITYNATALADLVSRPVYAELPGFEFHSPSIDPVSSMVVDNVAYRLRWNNGFDAVASVLSASSVGNDFILDQATNSKTDWIVTFPMRLPPVAPFVEGPLDIHDCLNPYPVILDREGAYYPEADFPEPPPSGEYVCWASTVVSFRAPWSSTSPQSEVLASANVMGVPSYLRSVAAPNDVGQFIPAIPVPIADGHTSLDLPGAIQSLPGSTAIDLATGATTTGAFSVSGMPVLGFMVRTFENGNLACGTATCQGNYSGAFQHRTVRQVTGP